MKITEDKWFELSDLMLGITREFNERLHWEKWSTSSWRMMSDGGLRDLLKSLGVEVE